MTDFNPEKHCFCGRSYDLWSSLRSHKARPHKTSRLVHMNPSLNSQYNLQKCEICDLYVDCSMSNHLNSTYHRYHAQQQSDSDDHWGYGGAQDDRSGGDEDLDDTLTGSETPPPGAADTDDVTEESPRQRRARIGGASLDWLSDRDDSSTLTYVDPSPFSHSAWRLSRTL